VEESSNRNQFNKKDLEESDELLIDLNYNAHAIFKHGERADDIVKNMLLHSRKSSTSL
jgi:hypothetical protein